MIPKTETIRVENLVTGYTSKHREVVITEGIDASLFSGELTCLLGPNGAGKSTLLKTLSGFIPPVSGNIIVEGKNLSSYTDAELSKLIGVVLTEKISLNNMSVYELVAMGRSPYTGFWGRLSTHDKDMVEEALSLVHINHLRDRMVNTLSDGERQNVMIAKALAQETPIIFLDEPTAFLDYPSKVKVMQLLQTLSRKKHKTVFLTTHDLEIALQIADKVWLIDKKHGVKIGLPEDLAAEGYIAKYFEREGVVYDAGAGLFRIKHKSDKVLRIEGDETRCNLMRRALARNGILADKDANTPDVITIDKNGYYFGGKRYETIEALINDCLPQFSTINRHILK